MAEGAGLLNRYRVYSSIEGSNPSPSAKKAKDVIITMGSIKGNLPPSTSVLFKSFTQIEV